MMKIILYACRILVGLTFLFSGTVKAIDPLGSVYKFHDYFSAFNLGFFNDLSLILTIILCSLEFLAGFSVLFNIRFRFGIWTVMLLMMLFTPLTLVLALTNPVSDCGCFGDAVHLTNWQTFFKNIILLVPSIWLFINRKAVTTETGTARGWALLSLAEIFFLVFLFYNLRFLPVIDFLPYKTGTYIPDKMILPEGKMPDKYETRFIYEKNGEKKEFSLDNYPANDTTWQFIDQKTTLVSKGYQPPIHDFILTSAGNEDMTDEILSSEGCTLLMISKKLEEADPEALAEGYEAGHSCKNNSFDFYILTASNSDQISSIYPSLPVLLVDETTLKTIVRSNPGYMLLKKGTIINKWSWANLPDKEELIRIMTLTNQNN